MTQYIDGFGDWFRIMFVLSSAAILILLGVRMWRVWSQFHWTQKIVFAALILYNIGFVGRSLELILKEDLAFSVWQVPSFIANALLVVYLWEPRSQYEPRLGQDLRNPHDPDLS